MPDFQRRNWATIFRQSIKRCSEVQAFVDRFLERVQSSCIAVRESLSTLEFEHQVGILKASFYYLLLSSESALRERNLPGSGAGRAAKRSKHVDPELRRIWIDCLIETVHECDPQFDDDVEHAWRVMIDSAVSNLPPEQSIR